MGGSMEKNNKKIIIGIVLIAVIIVGIIAFVFGQKHFKISKMEKTAEKYIEIGDYENAIATYNKLILKRDDVEYIEKLDLAKKLKKSDESFQEGEKQYKNSNYSKAILSYSEVLEEDKDNYKAAKDRIKSIKEIYISEIESTIEDLDFENAESKLAEYKDILDEETVLTYKEKITKNKEEEEKVQEEQKEKEELALAKAELEELMKEVTRISKQNLAANPDYRNLYYVTSNKANIRSGPSINASIITYVSKGSSVYIYDTVEDIGRTWCRAIITSSVTGNSYDGWISSRNLDYSL